jgi:membrane peptidoglycan carboxypeptidase
VLRFTWVFRMALVIGAGALLLTSVTIAVAPRVWRIANAHEETPIALPEFAALAARSYVYDARGNEIAVYEIENSQPIALGDVPTHVIDAFLAVEDREFYSHHGVNVRSLMRATLSNFASDGPVQGASTITMQVVKNDYMAGFERDGRYKLLQITYAVRLEKQMSKDEILERYLNTVFFGQNSYGIEAAAETYFGRSARELTFVQAAFLAGLVQAPSSYDPIINPERSRVRFTQVLDRLVDAGLMTEVEADAELEQFVLPVRVLRREERARERTYYTEALRDYLLNRSDILGDTYQERYTRLHRGGLSIHTTLDPVIQARAEEARNQLPDNGLGIDAALTSVETSTGAIRAMVGGKGFIPNEREVNLALAPSQTGSSIKLFVLAAALQAGATPDDIVDGTHPCTLPNPSDPGNPTFVIAGGVNGGVDTVRRHTTRSINCAYSRLAQMVGLNRMVDTVYRMAENPYLYRGQPVEERFPIWPFAAFSIGANELSTLDMAAGVQTIANEGVHMAPYYVEYIDDAEGNRVYTHVDPGTRVLDRDVALTAIDVLKGVNTDGTGRRELSEFAARVPSFGKTGTQDSNWTAYYAGATRYLSTAVLVRDPDRYTEMAGVPEFLAAGVDNVQGGTFPARIWRTFMEQVGLERLGGELDWPSPPPPERPPARLVLPGNECVFEIVGYEEPETTPPPPPAAGDATAVEGAAGESVTPNAAPPKPPDSAAVDGAQPATGWRAAAPSTSAPAPDDTTTTAPPVPIYAPAPPGTTIPPDVLDPNAPLPSVPRDRLVRPC